MLQTVRNYEVIVEPCETKQAPTGISASPKALIFYILEDNSKPVSVLDIGFGFGGLGRLIKSQESTRHWSVDGVDGWMVNCHNKELLGQKIYRNIWHGLAQDLPAEQIRNYDIVCLLDVIEHLNAETAKWLLRTLLSGLGEDSHLFVSTPLWFMPQGNFQVGDLEEHLIGVPASSMMALLPTHYAFNPQLVGGFVYSKRSLDYVELFQPCANKNFSHEMGRNVLAALNVPYHEGVLYKAAV